MIKTASPFLLLLISILWYFGFICTQEELSHSSSRQERNYEEVIIISQAQIPVQYACNETNTTLISFFTEKARQLSFTGRNIISTTFSGESIASSFQIPEPVNKIPSYIFNCVYRI